MQEMSSFHSNLILLERKKIAQAIELLKLSSLIT